MIRLTVARVRRCSSSQPLFWSSVRSDDLAGYACLAAATVIFCIGNITTSRRRLAAAAGVAIVVIAVKLWSMTERLRRRSSAACHAKRSV